MKHNVGTCLLCVGIAAAVLTTIEFAIPRPPRMGEEMAKTPPQQLHLFSLVDPRWRPASAPYSETKREEGASPEGEANHHHQIGVIKR